MFALAVFTIMALIMELLIPLGAIRIIIQGAILIVFILLAPNGLYGLLARRFKKIVTPSTIEVVYREQRLNQ
jgi:ABC-type branched-subunit amino acid transport system permease subunit